MKKLFMVLCIVIMFFGIVGCPSSDDPATTSSFTSKISTPVTTTDVSEPIDHSPFPVPEPATLLLLGSGLVCLAVIGRNKFKR